MAFIAPNPGEEFGGGFVKAVSIHSARGEFTEVTITLLCPEGISINEILSSKAVTKQLKEVDKTQRRITFED